jgi:host factor-I protein
MAEKPLSLQDHFLNSVRRAKSSVTIFLIKGVKLSGIVTWFDAFSLLLRRDGGSQLVYKHAISTIMPSAALAEFVPSQPGGPGGRAGKAALQDLFLAAAARDQEAMTLYLVNGVMLQGTVAGFDQFSLVLERGGQLQLVYKHAISTLQAARPLNLTDEESTDPSTEESTDQFTNPSTEQPTGTFRGKSPDQSPGQSTESSTGAPIPESED